MLLLPLAVHPWPSGLDIILCAPELATAIKLLSVGDHATDVQLDPLIAVSNGTGYHVLNGRFVGAGVGVGVGVGVLVSVGVGVGVLVAVGVGVGVSVLVGVGVTVGVGVAVGVLVGVGVGGGRGIPVNDISLMRTSELPVP